MSIVTNWVTPILTAMLILAFSGWILFLIYKGLSKLFPNLRYNLKYGLFKRKYDEGTVAWCNDAVNQDFDEVGVEKRLILSGTTPKKVKEIVYIYKKMKKVKGGLIKNEQRIGKINEKIR